MHIPPLRVDDALQSVLKQLSNKLEVRFEQALKNSSSGNAQFDQVHVEPIVPESSRGMRLDEYEGALGAPEAHGGMRLDEYEVPPGAPKRSPDTLLSGLSTALGHHMVILHYFRE